MANPSTTEIIEALASEIGENVYMDIAKWHLYLSDARLHTVIAEQLYPLLTSNSVDESRVLQVLKDIPVKIGGGKREVSLFDLIPTDGQASLIEILEEYQRKM